MWRWKSSCTHRTHESSRKSERIESKLGKISEKSRMTGLVWLSCFFFIIITKCTHEMSYRLYLIWTAFMLKVMEEGKKIRRHFFCAQTSCSAVSLKRTSKHSWRLSVCLMQTKNSRGYSGCILMAVENWHVVLCFHWREEEGGGGGTAAMALVRGWKLNPLSSLSLSLSGGKIELLPENRGRWGHMQKWLISVPFFNYKYIFKKPKWCKNGWQQSISWLWVFLCMCV